MIYRRSSICVKFLLFGVDHFLNSANGDRFLLPINKMFKKW
nr:MAG TPA: hypothetical protein [Caudoviricetes sp.]